VDTLPLHDCFHHSQLSDGLLTSHSGSDAHHSGSNRASQSPKRIFQSKDYAGLLELVTTISAEQLVFLLTLFPYAALYAMSLVGS
jgi:hypothetical protein